MAAANPVRSLLEEATCSICLEYYIDPVTTQCGHNFCRPCVNACLDGMGTALSCPQCRELCPRGNLRVNRQLQSMVELVKQLSVQQQRSPGEGMRSSGDSLCAEHKERLKLFCKEDEKLICLICRESKEHREHTVRPLEEAAQEYKSKLQDWLQTLRGELRAAQEEKLKEENYKDLRNKLEAERKKVKTEFQKLWQLLKEQEQTLLRRLEEMGKKIAIVENANIAKLSAKMSTLEALVTEIEKKCEQPAEELLKDIRSTLHRCEHVMDENPKRIMKKYKVLVTLDEDTAHDWLALSEEGRRVRSTGKWQGRPGNPKRFTHRPCVLGREGFTTGRHYWELQLLRDELWAVGVIRESVNRKEWIALTPETGAWTVGECNGQYWAFTSSQSCLSPNQRPLKLGLYLDYEGGRLSVYNADTMEALYNFTGAAFNGRVYPFFRVFGSADLRLV